MWCMAPTIENTVLYYVVKRTPKEQPLKFVACGSITGAILRKNKGILFICSDGHWNVNFWWWMTLAKWHAGNLVLLRCSQQVSKGCIPLLLQSWLELGPSQKLQYQLGECDAGKSDAAGNIIEMQFLFICAVIHTKQDPQLYNSFRQTIWKNNCLHKYYLFIHIIGWYEWLTWKCDLIHPNWARNWDVLAPISNVFHKTSLLHWGWGRNSMK